MKYGRSSPAMISNVTNCMCYMCEDKLSPLPSAVKRQVLPDVCIPPVAVVANKS